MIILWFGMITWGAYFRVLNLGKKISGAMENQDAKKKCHQRRCHNLINHKLLFYTNLQQKVSFLYKNITSSINTSTAEQLKLKSSKLQFHLPSWNCYSAQFNTNKIDTAFLWEQNWDSVPSTTPLPVTQIHKTSKLQHNAISPEQQPMKAEENLIMGDKEMRCRFPFWNELSRSTT